MSDGERALPTLRPIRRQRSATTVPIVKNAPFRPVKSIGRYASRYYCPSCGRKRGSCACAEDRA